MQWGSQVVVSIIYESYLMLCAFWTSKRFPATRFTQVGHKSQAMLVKLMTAPLSCSYRSVHTSRTTQRKAAGCRAITRYRVRSDLRKSNPCVPAVVNAFAFGLKARLVLGRLCEMARFAAT